MLCAKCNEIFKGSKRLSRCIQPNYDLDPFISGQHYDTLEEFQVAIKEGCHFCSLIIGSLDLQGSAAPWKWTHYTFGYPEGRSLTLKFSYKLPEQPGYAPRIDFRLYPVDEEDLMASLNLGGVESNTGSQSSWKQALSWIENCKTSHKTCRNSYNDEEWKPTRLLKVSEDPDFIRLCENDEIPDGTVYTTLSHCWGAVVLGTLLTTNRDLLKKSIPLSSLVKTFQNAVEVTRRLKVDYVWIDCLCIIQDSREDWKHESMRMEAVYGHSYCNIAATASADGRGGLFRERNPKMIEPCTISMSTNVKGKKINYQLSDFAIWWRHFEASPLNVRAWVMQERLLSPRVLQFDRDQLLWECNELTACERHPDGMNNLIPKDSTVRRFRLPPKEVVGASGVLDLWSPVLKIYSASRITKDTDRLVALYGVAMKIQRLLNCEYHAGLWVQDIESQLAWKVSDPTSSKRPSEHVAPSWSWASIVGEVNLMPQWDELDRASFHEKHLCKILSIENPANRQSDLVTISHEVLKVRCYLLPVTIIPIAQLYWDHAMPLFVDDEGSMLENIDQMYEGKSLLNDDEGGENEDEGAQGEDDEEEGESEDMEEQETPWVALYRTRDGQGMDLNLWREVDAETEWEWKTPRRRWLMPTCLSNGLMRGVILEKRKEDGGKFRKCGAFGYRSWEQSYEQGQDTFWLCSQDFKSAEGLEKQSFDEVLSPVIKDSAPDGESLLSYEVRNNVEQFVISII